MTSRPLRAVLLSALGLALVLGLGCNDPTLLLPGGALEGKEVAVPTSWTFSDDVSTVQLETNPADPYSVNIWAVGIEDRLYIHAGANRTTWVEHLEADSAVRVRIEDDIYPLRSARVTEQSEFDAFAEVYEEKYGNRPRNEDVGEAYLFRLVAR